MPQDALSRDMGVGHEGKGLVGLLIVALTPQVHISTWCVVQMSIEGRPGETTRCTRIWHCNEFVYRGTKDAMSLSLNTCK